MNLYKKFVGWAGLIDEREPPFEQSRARSGSYGGPRPPQRPQVRAVAEPPGYQTGQRPVAAGAPSYQRPPGTFTRDLNVVVRPSDPPRSMVGYTDVIEVHDIEDLKEVADRIRQRTPVLANMRDTDPALVRKLVDFASGLVYALDGTMRKASDGVLLILPPRVKILERELRLLSERGLYDLDR